MNELHSLIERLRTMRTEFGHRLDRIRHDRHHKDGPVSADFKEQVTERENDEVLARLETATTTDLRQIDHALSRVEAGLYPLCERCGERIEMQRLQAMPFATVCTRCVKAEERRRKPSKARTAV
ncbi:MAG TPA: TraR/DksA family transcriptional regulator [Nevskiaceae bacterium]|nr:TraR/DksA family transcriptional regulator [Nevskiaceae bacterium]